MAVAAIAIGLGISGASAHDVRFADGRPWPHNHADGYRKGDAIRNVSGTAPQVRTCDGATWPDIPASCLTRAVEAPSPNPSRHLAAEKGGRAVATLLAANNTN